VKDCGAFGCGATFDGFEGTICGFGAAFDRFLNTICGFGAAFGKIRSMILPHVKIDG